MCVPFRKENQRMVHLIRATVYMYIRLQPPQKPIRDSYNLSACYQHNKRSEPAPIMESESLSVLDWAIFPIQDIFALKSTIF